MSSASVAPGLGPVGQAVAGHIEPVTRFGAGDLRPQGPEEAVPALVRLALVQTVHFDVQRQSSPRQLPASVRAVAGEPALQAALAAGLQSAQADAPAALQVWSEAQGGAYRRLLPAEAAFARAPTALGYAHDCGSCRGAGKLACGTCGRRGRVTCSGCQGSRRTSCFSCSGSGQKSCSGCGGRGSFWRTETTQEWDSSRQANVSVTRNVTYACHGCGGSGREGCSSCGQSGRVTCTTCGGQGETRCPGCGGAGDVPCSPCEASGTVHSWGSVQARVQVHEELRVETADAALAALVQQRVDRAALPALGQLQRPQHAVQGQALHSRYAVALQVRRATLVAGGRAFVFHGLGDPPQVFDHGNIAGHLLGGDLQALEAALAAGSRWRPGGALVERTQAFVESELNLAIAEAVSQQDAKPAAAAEAVERQHAGLVDADYVARAVTALRAAFGRLYAASLWKPAAALVAGGGVAAALLALWSATGQGVGLPLAGTAVTLVLAWLGLEWWAQRRVTQRFPAGLAARVAGQIRDSGTRRRWRLVAAGALLLAGGAAAVTTLQTPWARRMQLQRTQLAFLQMAMVNWQRQPQADFRLRHYPTDAELERGAEAGVALAAVLRAWRALAPPPGRSAEPAVADRWLQGEGVNAVALGRVARAVLVLQQPGTEPGARRDALALLASAADAGLLEARYWQGRFLLEEAPPLHNPTLGLRRLSEAADRQHASAALLLGQRLAQGIDGRRDLNLARRYLQQARRAGLTEADAALAALR